jgi:O-antigen/teichoic acid export membrane protein
MTDSRRIGANSAWMMTDQVFRQALGLMFSIWIARQYGPEAFGTLSFGLAFCALFGVVGTLGLNRILVRELANPARESREADLLGVVISMRLLAGVLIAIATILTGLAIAPEKILLVSILSLGLLLTPFDAIDLYYQSRLQSSVVARVRMTALTVSGLVKAALLLRHADIAWLAAAYVLDWTLAALALRMALRRTGSELPYGLGDGRIWRQLLGESWPEIFAGFSVMVFMRIDQVMLHSLRGATEVAIMAVSSRLTEAWYFVPASIVSSTYPIIVAMDHTDSVGAQRKQMSLYRQLMVISLAAAVVATLLGDSIIDIIYGQEYSPAAQVLAVQAWCGFFMSLGIASGTWLMARKLARFNLYRNACGAGINVALNLILIPSYGAVGAAWATLAAFAFAYLAFDFLVPEMREVGRAKLRALGIG